MFIYLNKLYNHQLIVNSGCCSVAKSGLTATPWTAAHQASLSFTISWSLLKLMSIESVMPSNHLILCRPLLLLPSVFPSTRVFSSEFLCSNNKLDPGSIIGLELSTSIEQALMFYHNSNILLFYNVFDFASLTSISQSFYSYFFCCFLHITWRIRNVQWNHWLISIPSIAQLKITLGCFGTWVMKFRRRNFYELFKLWLWEDKQHGYLG